MDITNAIEQIVPSAQYGGYPRNEQAYNKLRWTDARPQPAWADIALLLPDPTPIILDPARKAPPVPSGNSIPALRDEVAALRQVLIDAGILDA